MIAFLIVLLSFVGLIAQPFSPAQEKIQGQELFDGFFVSTNQVYFMGEISIDAHHPETPDVFLEMLVTAPDSREHESLIVSSVRPALFHASLLAADINPGKPISFTNEGPIAANGDQVSVSYLVLDEDQDVQKISSLVQSIDHEGFRLIQELVVHVDDQYPLNEESDWNGLVFAGSRLGKQGYEADQSGALISLTPFGDEVVSPKWTLSHRESIDPAVWIANTKLIPTKGTQVILRVEKIESVESDIDSDED